jgi:hypothetical protein
MRSPVKSQPQGPPFGALEFDIKEQELMGNPLQIPAPFQENDMGVRSRLNVGD